MPRRPDGTITQARLDQLSQVRGHLIPVGFVEDPLPGRDQVAELSPEDFHRVMQGYACGNGGCLAYFAVPLLECPVCGQRCGAENLAREVPPEWAEHRKAREDAPPTPRLPRGRVSPETAIARVRAHPDVEHVQLSKLGPRRRG